MATDEDIYRRKQDSQDERNTRERESVTGNRSELKDSEEQPARERDKAPAGSR